VIGANAAQAPYEGTRYAWLGGNGRRASETLRQQSPSRQRQQRTTELRAAHRHRRNQQHRLRQHDRHRARASGSMVLATLATYTNLTPAAGYQIRSFDLLPFKGQNLTCHSPCARTAASRPPSCSTRSAC
jgi:hypothetical protein